MFHAELATLIKQANKQQTAKEVTVADILQYVNPDDLRQFVSKKALYDTSFAKDVMLAFAEKVRAVSERKRDQADVNPYKVMVRKGLDEVDFDDEYGYDEVGCDLSVLEEWVNKAKSLVEEGKPADAILVVKACIEAYAEWLDEQDEDITYLIEYDYMDNCFLLLRNIADQCPTEQSALYEYLKSEVSKDVYDEILRHNFYDLMASVAGTTERKDFIVLQFDLLSKVPDKTSSDYQSIMQRIIDTYRRDGKEQMAEQLLCENVQCLSFRRQLVNSYISSARYSEAKKLIYEYLEQNNEPHRTGEWKRLLLAIAQKENDIVVIRQVAKELLFTGFDDELFTIYKKTFTTVEWQDKFEELLNVYVKGGGSLRVSYRNNVTRLLNAEKQYDRLMQYIEAHVSDTVLMEYQSVLADKHPEKYLLLFEIVILDYLERNIGRQHYEHVLELLKSMLTIKGGRLFVNSVVNTLRQKYSNRPALKDVLGRLR